MTAPIASGGKIAGGNRRAHGLGQTRAADLADETVRGVADCVEAGAPRPRLEDGWIRQITAGDVVFRPSRPRPSGVCFSGPRPAPPASHAGIAGRDPRDPPPDASCPARP